MALMEEHLRGQYNWFLSNFPRHVSEEEEENRRR